MQLINNNKKKTLIAFTFQLHYKKKKKTNSVYFDEFGFCYSLKKEKKKNLENNLSFIYSTVIRTLIREVWFFFFSSFTLTQVSSFIRYGLWLINFWKTLAEKQTFKSSKPKLEMNNSLCFEFPFLLYLNQHPRVKTKVLINNN